MASDLKALLEMRRPTLEAICAALQAEAERLAFPGGNPIQVERGGAAYRLEKDPASGQPTLRGDWFTESGQRNGTVVVHADGTFFAEYDVVRPHPRNRRWFVEAVTAWGRDGVLKSEPRLLEAPS